MSFLHICLFAAISFAVQSLQDQDPLQNFCRRWGHQAAKVGNRLYIDGGLTTYGQQSASTPNNTNTFLLFSDLNSTTADIGMPQQYSNLSKPSDVPSVAGGILWPDEVNKALYLYGGEYQDTPKDFALWTYDIILNKWNKTDNRGGSNSIQRVSYGAGASLNELGVGYYYGGYLNNKNVPGWSGPQLATSNLIRYDFSSGSLTNNSGPDSTPRAEGVMLSLNASDGGLLVYFGGLEDPGKNGTYVGANMSTIHIFDVSSSKWYTQTASGSIPPARRQFCAGATWADDHSSYNIYLYGGFGIQNITGFDDIYILSLPSFQWIKAWPNDGSNGTTPHGALTCNVINQDQMIVMGGWFHDSTVCDSPNGWGQHNMNLGMNGPQRAIWDKYDPAASKYFVPTPVISSIGGGPTGSATATKPSNWDNPDLSVYFTRVPSFSTRAATRTIPTSTASPTGGSGHKTKVGAIAGGVVGGLVVLIAILSLILFCLHRRKKNLKTKDKASDASPPPQELPATAPVHEMSSPGATKFLMNQQQSGPDPNSHPAYANSPQSHQRTLSGNQVAPDFQYAQVGAIGSQGSSPYSQHAAVSSTGNYSPRLHNTYPPYTDQPWPTNSTGSYNASTGSYNPEAYPSPHTSNQQMYNYPTPTSPHGAQHQQLYDPPINQTYYPPPQEPGTRSPPPQPTSTANTPAHFYSQPAKVEGAEDPRNLMAEGIREGTPTSSIRGSVDGRQRPVRGRFVEVDHM